MLRRLLVAAVAALSVAAAVPADAAAPTKLYLNQLNSDCSSGAAWGITTVPDDSGSCVIIPRLLADGQGLPNENESFATSKKQKTMRIDATKKLTGTFALFGSSGLRAAQGPAVLAADFTVKLGGVKVGVVHVEGIGSPAAPVTQTFSLTIPKSLNKVKTNKVNVTVEWVSCVGLCGVGVSGQSFLAVPTK